MKDQQDPKINELLEEFSTSRGELTKYMLEVEQIRAQVIQIFPNNQDYRNKFVLEEKIKAMSSFYTMILNIRQEYNKIIKDEIEIRRKIAIGDKGDLEDGLDIRQIADMIEQDQKKRAESENIDIGVEEPSQSEKVS